MQWNNNLNPINNWLIAKQPVYIKKLLFDRKIYYEQI